MYAEGKDGFPSLFGRYTLIERLATGGMAEVFKAKITAAHGFEKLLVIKRILPNLAADRTFVSMFIDEAKLTAQLIHPKIVQVIDFGEVNGQYFIALEYVDGFDALALLRSAATKQIRLPLPIGMFITMELLDALDYAHNACDAEGKPMRLVHRDISPSNVFIARRGDVKLGDFGIAHAQERESKTQAGTLKGKYGYMSPEQVVGGALDGRSDIFAVGIVLAEMLMGRRLFTAPNDLDVLLMVRDGRLERLDRYASDIPPSLDKIVRKALAKRVGDRFQSAAEFRDALGDLLFQVGFRVAPPDVGRIASDFFDASPEANGRLADQCRRWEMRGSSAPAAAAAPMAAPRSTVEPAPAVARPGRPVEDPVDVVIEDDISGPRGQAIEKKSAVSPIDPQTAEALANLLSQPLSVVDLDEYAATPPPGPAPVAVRAAPPTPVAGVSVQAPAAPAAAGARTGVAKVPAPAAAVPAAPPPEVGQFVPARVDRPADTAADLAAVTPMRIFADLAAAGETGLLRFEIAPHVKEVYLVRGAPESINSSLRAERFGEYLVARGFLRAGDLQSALTQLPRFSGKLGDTLVGLGLMKPLDVFRLLSDQVRERVIEIFGWVQGRVSFFRGVRNPQEAFPLGLDPFEILGTGVLNLPYDHLERRFLQALDFRPRAFNPPRINPEAFRLGPTPRDVWGMLDGSRTVRDWMARFTSPDELVTFLRTLYLLIETGLVGYV